MSEKEKKFPLPLSSVLKPKSKHSPKVGLKPIISNLLNQPYRQKSTVNKLTTIKEIISEPVSSIRPKNITDFKHARHAMRIRLEKQGISNKTVLEAMEKAPRHLFLDTALYSKAYTDASLPIGHRQTISQPYIVAKMIEVLLGEKEQKSFERVLEIGTGCGYQAMVLSLVFKEVYSIERIKALHELAKNRLRPLRVPNIRLQYGDGMLGLSQAAPFDAIILAAAGLEAPKTLLEQLSIGGRLVAPVGAEKQNLLLIERTGKNEWKEKSLEKCYFVPLVSGTI